MTKREFFRLNFYKVRDTFGDIIFFCEREVIGNYSELQILSHLSKNEIDGFLHDIDYDLISGVFPEIFIYSDGIGADEVKIIPPNMIINDICTISLVDMKALLLEWKDFINS